MHHHHQVGRSFGDRDADVTHIGRQPRLRDRDAVLHLHLRDIEISPDIEGHRNREPAVAGRVRGHVQHVLDTVDLLSIGATTVEATPRSHPDTDPRH